MMAGDIIAAQHFIENLEKKVQAANHNATGVSQKIDSVSTKHKKTNQIQTYYRNEQAMHPKSTNFSSCWQQEDPPPPPPHTHAHTKKTKKKRNGRLIILRAVAPKKIMASALALFF